MTRPKFASRGKYCVIEDGVIVGDNVKIGHHVILRAGTEIGDNVQIGDNVSTTGACIIGNNVAIRTGAIVSKAVIIEDDVFIGPSVVTNHTRRVRHMRGSPAPILVTRIGRGAVIGASSWILAGVTIAPSTILGGGSLITKDITDPGVYVGNPPRKLRDLTNDERIAEHFMDVRYQFTDEVVDRYLPEMKINPDEPTETATKPPKKKNRMWGNPDVGFLVKRGEDMSRCMICVGGWYGEMGGYPIEFARMTGFAKYTRIFLRDTRRAWYHLGVQEDMDFPQTVQRIKDELRVTDCKYVTVVGVSMGGYAAILLGHFLKANEVHSFAGPTSIKPGAVIRIRKHVQLAQDEAGPVTRKYLDLADLLAIDNRTTVYHLYYCELDKFDEIQALHMRGLPGVVLHPYPCATHAVTHYLKAQGILQRIIINSGQEDGP